MQTMKNVCLLLAGAALVAAKTGKTLDPMYDAESVCKDWWHAAEEGCFDPANPDADRRWPDAQLEAIFTEALEGREPVWIACRDSRAPPAAGATLQRWQGMTAVAARLL